MRKLNQSGSLLLPFVITLILFLSAAGFGIWAFMSRQDYKNNSDLKAAQVAKQTVAAEDVKKDAVFEETEKSPFKIYKGSATYGSLSFQYPKTWSAYISETGKNGNIAVDGYFSPDFVPDIGSGASFALRFQVVSSDYTAVVQAFDNFATKGNVTVSAYRAPKVSSTLGVIISGTISQKKQGTMVILPLRDKTIQIWTEANDSMSDFTSTVLNSLTFIP